MAVYLLVVVGIATLYTPTQMSFGGFRTKVLLEITRHKLLKSLKTRRHKETHVYQSMRNVHGADRSIKL